MLTEQQEQALNAYKDTGSKAGAARQLGISRQAYSRLLDRAQKWVNAPEGQKAAIEVSGLNIGTAKHGWRVIQHENGSRDSVFWKDENAPDPNEIIEALKEGLADVEAAKPIPAPPVQEADLCAVFPVADLHIGMLTDAEEVGEDWDSKIAIRRFKACVDTLMQRTPPTSHAVIANIGDLSHNDDQSNQTKASRHQLDVDSRYFAVLRRSVEAMKYIIGEALKRHGQVTYRGSRGNHDPTTHYAVTLALSEHYRDEPRVTIDDSAMEFYVFEWGVNMLLFCHGDRTKPDRLSMFMASQWPEIWGRTTRRRIYTGHVHHKTAQEYPGVIVETMQTIIPRDAYAFGHGYKAERSLVSICFDKTQGEISRNLVNGEMV